MNAKRILTLMAFLLGEALTAAAFFMFGGRMDEDVRTMNLVVSSFIYGLFFIDVFVSWLDLGDKSGRKTGSLGVRWFFTLIYVAGAIAVMIVGSTEPVWTFSLQALLHGGLLFVLLLGLAAAFRSGGKSAEIYREESFNRCGVDEMKSAMHNLLDKAEASPELPESLKRRMAGLCENLRFLSPSNSAEAHALERSFTATVNGIAVLVADYPANRETMESELREAERIHQNRKSIYSN